MAINFAHVTVLPYPPQKTDPVNFAERADLFLDALPGFGTELNVIISELSKITSGLDQASPIAAWDSGTSYSFPTVVAGTDGASYRCIDTDVTGVDPVTDDGTYWYNLSGNKGGLPVGSIIPWSGGYYTDGNNGGFTSVLGNNITTINALVNPDGFYACDGSELDLADSPIYSGAGRYLPNLTGDIFLMGDVSVGATGGANTMPHVHGISHTHTVNIPSFNSGSTTLSTSQMPVHSHRYKSDHVEQYGDQAANHDLAGNYGNSTETTGGSGSHYHSVNPPSTATSASSLSNSGGASYVENRPNYVGVIYLKRVK